MGNCLRQPGPKLYHPKVYVANYTSLFNLFLHLDQSCFRDKVNGAVVRRAVVMVFASSS
jgi:hypothetical protein